MATEICKMLTDHRIFISLLLRCTVLYFCHDFFCFISIQLSSCHD